MTKHIVTPALWLMVSIAGLSLLSETVYTPSLPDIACALRVSESMVEYTLTIYLVGFAVGVFLWGTLSDRLGRKPCVVMGLLIFTGGCIGCYFSPTIIALMMSRLVQGFGASIGSVLGQAICRDAFHGPALGRAYASVGGAMALFPALGPVVGGLITEILDWPHIFLFLTAFALGLTVIVMMRLPETHPIQSRQSVSVYAVLMRLIRDKKVMGLSMIVSGCNGIYFSYFAEGSFYLIKILGLSPSQYGYSFILIAASAMLGASISKKLHHRQSGPTIMFMGLIVIGCATLGMSGLILWHSTVSSMAPRMLMMIVLGAFMVMELGINMTTSNALALALIDYKNCTGTASSLFGCSYYVLTSLFTWGMGSLHNGTLWPMPLYFLTISALMLIVYAYMGKNIPGFKPAWA